MSRSPTSCACSEPRRFVPRSVHARARRNRPHLQRQIGYGHDRSEHPQFWAELGSAYGELVLDRDLLLVMLHGFATSTDDVAASPGTPCPASPPCCASAPVAHPSKRVCSSRTDADQHLLAMMAPEHAEEDPALGELWGSVFQRLDCDHAHRRRILERNRHRFLTGHWKNYTHVTEDTLQSIRHVSGKPRRKGPDVGSRTTPRRARTDRGNQEAQARLLASM